MKQTRDGGTPPPHHPHRRRPSYSGRRPPWRRAAPSTPQRPAAVTTGTTQAPRFRWALGLGALLLVLAGGILGIFQTAPAHLEIQPRPEGLDPVTYNNAVRIVDIAKGFAETQREVAAFRAELTPH